MRPLRSRLALLLLLLALPLAAPRAQEPLSCALVAAPALGFADSAAFNLLAVQLSNQPGLALLERAEVAQLLKERALQLTPAFAAAGLVERRALGMR